MGLPDARRMPRSFRIVSNLQETIQYLAKGLVLLLQCGVRGDAGGGLVRRHHSAAVVGGDPQPLLLLVHLRQRTELSIPTESEARMA